MRRPTEEWTAARCHWGGGRKDNVRSGCGVVIKTVVTDDWITVSKCAMPSKVCTAMAAEIAGAGMLTGGSSRLLLDKKTQSGKTSTVVLTKSYCTLETRAYKMMEYARDTKDRPEDFVCDVFLLPVPVIGGQVCKMRRKYCLMIKKTGMF